MPPRDHEDFSQRLLATRTIASAMMGGLALLAVLVLFLTLGANVVFAALGPGSQIISFTAVGAAALIYGSLFLIIPSMNRGRLRLMATGQLPATPEQPEGEAGQLAALWTQNVLLLYSLLEGPAILALLAYLLEQQPFVLAVPAVALLVMTALFPSDQRFQRWLEQQRSRLEEMKRNGT